MQRPREEKAFSRASRAWIVLSVLLAAGCTKPLDTSYGKRQTGWDNQSVNGTGVFSMMFEERGHHVTTWRWLSPRLERRTDVIVWFDQTFDPPDQEVREWLEDWLIDRPGRTLIYVGRDFDAAPLYWRKVRERYPEYLRQEADARLIEAEQEFAILRGSIPPTAESPWFELAAEKKRRVRSISASDPSWLVDCTPSMLEIELFSRMVPAEDFEVLLSSDDEMLVARSEWGESQLVLVTNGSFLLNLPLVNREHRRLADQLIKLAGPAPKEVVFLEPFFGEPQILETDPELAPSSPLRVLSVEPLGRILLHLVALGIIFCFSRWPTLGATEEPPPSETADFGQHVLALGRLLKRTGDADYAQRQVELYHQRRRRDGRRRHAKGSSAGSSAFATR